MAKTKVSSTDLIWIIQEDLQALDDYPVGWLPIAVVPTPDGGWRALTDRYVRAHQARWVERIEAIEKRLRKIYALKD
jgi:hypothetical protein